jgi:hypothetical protein
LESAISKSRAASWLLPAAMALAGMLGCSDEVAARYLSESGAEAAASWRSRRDVPFAIACRSDSCCALGLGAHSLVFVSVSRNSGSDELALERWLGHSEVLSGIAGHWASIATFLSAEEVSTTRAAVRAARGGGGGGGGAGGGGGGAGGAGGGSAAGGDSGAGAAASTARLEEIGKIIARNKRLARELANLKSHSALNLDVSPVNMQLDRWLVR